MNLTVKQIELLHALHAKNDDGSSLDIDQITETVSWRPSKQSLQFSLRALINKGLIVRARREKRRGQNRTVIELTSLGRSVMGAGASEKSLEAVKILGSGVDDLNVEVPDIEIE